MIKEPTSEECSNRSPIFKDGRQVGYATWYPQMGGYGGKCIVLTEKENENNTCFDVFVWHDSEFPFSGLKPVEIHHCMAEQFIRFGEEVLKYQKTK